MKKISYPYYLIMLALWPVVICSIVSVWSLLILPLYTCWFLFSPFLFYHINRKRELKPAFVCTSSYQAQGCTIWFDHVHGELAILFVLCPFKVQYFSSERVKDVHLRIDYNKKDRRYADRIVCIMTVDDKVHNISLASVQRHYLIDMESNGKYILNQMENLINDIHYKDDN